LSSGKGDFYHVIHGYLLATQILILMLTLTTFPEMKVSMLVINYVLANGDIILGNAHLPEVTETYCNYVGCHRLPPPHPWQIVHWFATILLRLV
jgi:hypothetical protein